MDNREFLASDKRSLGFPEILFQMGLTFSQGYAARAITTASKMNNKIAASSSFIMFFFAATSLFVLRRMKEKNCYK